MNIHIIVLLVINDWYPIHFTYFYCSYTKNRIKYLGTSSKSLIEGTVGLTSTKDLLDSLVRQNVTYPVNSQPKFHNIQRMPRCLGSSIITTDVGKNFVFNKKMVSARRISILWTFRLCRVIFDRPMK